MGLTAWDTEDEPSVASASVPRLASTVRALERAQDLALVVVGLGAVALAGYWDTSMVLRWMLGGIGVWSCVRAIDRVGKRRIGPRFEVGTVLSLTWIVLLLLAAAFADLLPLERPRALPLDSTALARPDLLSAHPLGTDNFGRDYAARLVYGARVSLLVGIGTTLIGLTVGMLFGVLAGYFRGKLEAFVNAAVDFLLALPPLVFLLALVSILRPGLGSVFVGLSILMVPVFVRLAKANAVRIVEREYVLAAAAMGATRRRIMLREITPNVLPPLFTYAIVVVPSLIVAEAALSFLGLSVQLPYPTWGNMIAESQTIFPDHPHTVLLPGLVMFLTVFSLNRLGQLARARWQGER